MTDQTPSVKRGPGRPRKDAVPENPTNESPVETIHRERAVPDSTITRAPIPPTEPDVLLRVATELADGRSVLESRFGVGVCLRRYSTPELAQQGRDEINATLLQQANPPTMAAFTIEVL